MKTPICTFDAKTAILCAKCETKLRSGQLTDADIEGAIKITKLAERNQDINKFTMTSASKVDEDFIIALSGADIGTIRSNPTLLKKFEEEFQSKVWFVEAQATNKRFIENLFFPTKVLGVNILWLPDGSKLTKVIISASDKIGPQQHPNIEKVKQIARKIRNIELLVEFENPN
ncbi:MAG: transcription elongation factor NusA [Nitrososphaeraceae archaeon]